MFLLSSVSCVLARALVSMSEDGHGLVFEDYLHNCFNCQIPPRASGEGDSRLNNLKHSVIDFAISTLGFVSPPRFRAYVGARRLLAYVITSSRDAPSHVSWYRPDLQGVLQTGPMSPLSWKI